MPWGDTNASCKNIKKILTEIKKKVTVTLREHIKLFLSEISKIGNYFKKLGYKVSRILGNPVLGVSDPVQHKPSCTATGGG